MTKRILIVDDVEINRGLLSVALEDMYSTVEACDGSEAIDILEKEGENIIAVLLDLIMPKASGFDVLEYMHKNSLLEHIPVVVISVETTREIEKKCLELGVSDFIQKPFSSDLVRCRVRNIIELFNHKNNLEQSVKEKTAELERQNELLREKTRLEKRKTENTIDILGSIVESRHLESGLHIKRVKGYTKILAKKAMEKYPEYGLTNDKIKTIVITSALHDIGKIAIRDDVLLKPGRLTKDEFEHMKTHTTTGCEMLKHFHSVWNDEYTKVSYAICRWHHERFDGRGYPDGLKGDDIPIEAQIVSIADVYDALTSKRVYKDAVSSEKAYDMILNNECGVFSPKLIDCFKDVKEEFEEVLRIS